MAMPKKPALLMSVLLIALAIEAGLVVVAPANFFPAPGPDLPRIYIRNDGTVEPTTAPIVPNGGGLYRLSTNVVLCTIEIQADNVVLDGFGCKILGNASWVGTAPRFGDAGNNGVLVSGRNNITLSDLDIEQCTTGIRIINSTNVRVVGCTLVKETAAMSSAVGVVAKDSSLVQIENNTFNDIEGSAIVCNGTRNTIKRNFITNVYGDMDGALHLEGSENTVSENHIEAMLPITMDKADSNVVAGNVISGQAIALAVSGGVENRTGSEGIALFVNCSNNLISNNKITGFINQAIRTVFTCSNNTFCGNYLANNGFAAALQSGAENSLFYGNTFTADSCKFQIDDGARGTRWDNGTVGNFWGDYTGVDGNGDGIGDTPYAVNGSKWDNSVGGFVSFVAGKDNYPLMKPIAVFDSAVPTPNPTSSSNPTSPPSPTPTPSTEPTQSTGTTETPWRDVPYRPSPLPMQIALIALVVAVVFAAFYFKRRRDRKMPQ